MARQVSRDAIVACDPAMCAALQADGIAPGNLLVLRPSSGDPLGSDVVIATPAVRSQFGRRLASVYAPVVIASFGTGALRIDVRAMAPDGAAAYRAALAADLAARRGAGQQLLRNPRVGVSAAARSDLARGRVDARLLLMLAAVASVEPVRVAAFTDSGPGAAPGVPLRAVELTGAGPGPRRARPRLRCHPGQWIRHRPGCRAAEGARLRARAAPALPPRPGRDRPRARGSAAAQRGVRRAQPRRADRGPAADQARPRLAASQRPARPARRGRRPPPGPGPQRPGTRNPQPLTGRTTTTMTRHALVTGRHPGRPGRAEDR